ncbi:MAG: caspase family protein [Bacteroidales bacterium]
MKKVLLISLLFPVSTIVSVSQLNYNDYPENLKKNVINENFKNNDNKWALDNSSDNSADYKIKNGSFQIKVPDKNNIGLQCIPVSDLNQNKNWEIETRVKYSGGSVFKAFALIWGYKDGNSQGYFFFIDARGLFKIQKKDTPGSNFINYKDWAPARYVNKSDWNKLTVRKVDDKCYFFINEHLISSVPFESFYGDEVGFYCGGGLTLQAEYLKVSYIEAQNNLADNTPPEITIYEPSFSRGVEIIETNKEISVKGKASSGKGINEVTINGIEANVNGNGDFQQDVKLAAGENTITVIATDINNHTGSLSFNVNRQSEAANNAVAINDNPVMTKEKRLALVIGNSNYGAGLTLKNSANDANLMSATLQNLGFEVIKRIDANKQSMEQAVRDFSKQLPDCNVALFYYAGHGLQVDGINYLIPTDAKLKDKSDCKFEAIQVNYVVEEFEKYPNNVNIVILDACRSNPFRSWTRGGEGGFKAINPTSGTIISFATSEGSTASDGSGKNGLFTEELVKQMTIPQPIESVFKKTRVQVQKRSNGAQSPQEWSQLTGDFYFKK